MTTDTLSAITTRIRGRESVDIGLLGGLLLVAAGGIVGNYSASRQRLINAGENPHYYLERQALFVVLGFIAMFIVARIDYRRYEIAATPLYIISLFALAGVFVIGQSALGAERWYSFGSTIQVQPSEFAVLFLILAIATFCGRRSEGLKMYDVIRLLVMAVVPLVLIVKQPD